VANDPKQIRRPGEYEIGGTFITGVASFHDDEKGQVRGKNTIYVIEMDGMTLCHLGDLGHPLDSHLIEEIGDVSILFLPVGEVSTIPIDTATEIIRQLEPAIVIPMHYKTEVFAGNLSPVDKFLDTMRIKDLAAKPKLSITLSSLPSSTQTIVLSHV
jgi:L-ascorbate metabolism protein UlaG (beta-lactamase superfamily)